MNLLPLPPIDPVFLVHVVMTLIFTLSGIRHIGRRPKKPDGWRDGDPVPQREPLDWIAGFILLGLASAFALGLAGWTESIQGFLTWVTRTINSMWFDLTFFGFMATCLGLPLLYMRYRPLPGQMYNVRGLGLCRVTRVLRPPLEPGAGPLDFIYTLLPEIEFQPEDEVTQDDGNATIHTLTAPAFILQGRLVDVEELVPRNTEVTKAS